MINEQLTGIISIINAYMSFLYQVPGRFTVTSMWPFMWQVSNHFTVTSVRFFDCNKHQTILLWQVSCRFRVGRVRSIYCMTSIMYFCNDKRFDIEDFFVCCNNILFMIVFGYGRHFATTYFGNGRQWQIFWNDILFPITYILQ